MSRIQSQPKIKFKNFAYEHEAGKTAISKNDSLLIDSIPQLFWLHSHVCKYLNLPLRQYLGVMNISEQEFNLLHYIHPEDVQVLDDFLHQAIVVEHKFEKSCRIRNQQGEYHWFLIQAELENSPIGGFKISCTNIHQGMKIHIESLALLRAHADMLDASVDCIIVVDPDGTITHMNKSACENFFGRADLKEFGMSWIEILPQAIRKKAKKAMLDANNGKNSRFNGMSFSKDSVYYWDNVLTPVLDVDGKTQSILCVSRDVTLQYLAEQELKQGNERDELTGLNNRRAFKEKIRKLYTNARDKKQKLAVMLLDLDHFKTINDTLGYAAGDHLLRILSKRLKQTLEGRAFLARLGGDEFGVIIPHVRDIGELNEIAQLILKQLEIPITFAGNYINGGMSIGCGLYPDDASDIVELMKCADTALTDVKAQGRGGMRMFDQDMFNAVREHSAQLNCAHQIIRNLTIEAYFQPKVCLKSEKIIGYEALLRWRDEHNNIQSPARIAAAFNDYELSSRISEIMQNQVFKQITEWLAKGLKVVPISINAAPVEFMRDNFAEIFLKRLKTHAIPAKFVEIEVTEYHLAERGYEYVIRALKKLKANGVRIALDDFGTGHSSLTHLRDYPVDIIKVDCSFVQRLSEDKSIYAIVEGLAKLGPLLSMDIIAEGIETATQLQLLREMGCHIGQGYLFSPPVSAQQAEIQLLKRH